VTLPSQGAPAADARDARLFAAMRFILAFAGLAIIYLDPTEPSANAGATYGAFALYCAYALGVLVTTWKAETALDQRLLCALDIVFGAFLVLWTHGTNSIFFYVFLFPILVVSFSHGYRDGLAFTVASLAAFLVSGSIASPPIVTYELDLALIRPVYLLALGYMIARWGGRELSLKRRLMLLRDVTATSARADVDDVLLASVRRLREFHDAASCALLVCGARGPSRYFMYSASPEEQRTSAPREIDRISAEQLLGAQRTACILYATRRWLGRPRASAFSAGRTGELREIALPAVDYELIAGLLDAPHFVGVPYSQSDGTYGRLFLASSRRYTREDLAFVLQFAAALAKVVENLRLVAELVSSAAERERTTISRDIHDATVQPYIGLRLALEALYLEGGPANPLSGRIHDLIDMANTTVRDLRGYTRGLVAGNEIPGGTLGAAILMQADRHRRFYGLDVATDIDAASGAMTGRDASQVFFIVVEALTNVVKHTGSRRAFVRVESQPGGVRVHVGNEVATPPERAFVPKSIGSRVESLGGTLRVEHSDGYTWVEAFVPRE
jgi:signal transduction histidine kinase